ncbi:MAG: hypothetical protein KDJ34_16635 [Candidatus Competibacteraceae bacterium]|nr:hypothetical protein [Candidatus Competibacteraceae bacterium]
MKRYANYHAFPRKAMATVATTAMLAMVAPAYAGDHQRMTAAGITNGFGPLYKEEHQFSATSPSERQGLDPVSALGTGVAVFALWCLTVGCFDSPEQAEERQRADEELSDRMAEELFRWSVKQ